MTSSSLSIPLTRLAHQEAQQFYQDQKDPQKAKEIYLNCLAVYAVNYYLNCLAISTNKKQDTRQVKIQQTLANMAELEIINQGKLECRPVLPNEQTCYIPAETWLDRIGYVAVQLNQSLTEAQLIGFLESINTEKVELSAFQSLDQLWEKITPSTLIRLSEWLKGQIAKEWQDLSNFINPQSLQEAVRNSPNSTEWIKQGKLVNLSSLSKPLVLGVAIESTEDTQPTISIEIYPSSHQSYLPLGIQMQILDESENSLMQATTQDNNPYLRFRFRANQGDKVVVEITFQSVSFREEFII